VGNSLVEEEQQSLAADLVAEAEAKGKRLLLPVDAVASESVSADAKATVVPIDAVPDGAMGLDIGPATIAEWEAVLGDAGTVVWNGPMGVFESAPFAKGTLAIAESLAAQTARGAITIVGGGDSVAAINQAGLASSMSHVSTGGGASLELLEGLVLPGVAALDDVVS
jgi:phosphoglycerate kinase